MYKLSDINQAFREIETKLNLFERQIGGCYYWDYLRYPCYIDLLTHHGLFPAHTEQTFLYRINKRVKQLTNLARFSRRRSCFSAPQADYVFFGHPRRKLERDGHYWDIYCDPIVENLSERHVVLERAYEHGPPYHFQPAKTVNLWYLDAIQLSALLRKRWKHVSLTQSECTDLRILAKYFQEDLGTPIAFEDKVTNLLGTRDLVCRSYVELLKRMTPRIVFLVVSAGQEHVIEACRSLRIPSVELQHGAPSKNKLNYDYADSAGKHYFPDYVFVFGRYWIDNVNWPVERKNILVMGYPYLEGKLEKYRNISKNDQLLVISQPTIGKELSNFIIRLRELHQHIAIMFKLHPVEVIGWRKRYGHLVDAGVKVIDSNDPDLYLLQAQSRWQIGVYSTALYEGCAFGCRTFLVQLPGVEYMTDFVDRGLAKVVNAPEEVELHEFDSLIDRSEIFARDWQSNWVRSVADIDASHRYLCATS